MRDIPFRIVFALRMPKPQRLPNVDEQALLAQLQVRLVLPGETARWNQLVRRHHCLKSSRLVGEQRRYVVSDAQGTWLALSLIHI